MRTKSARYDPHPMLSDEQINNWFYGWALARQYLIYLLLLFKLWVVNCIWHNVAQCGTMWYNVQFIFIDVWRQVFFHAWKISRNPIWTKSFLNLQGSKDKSTLVEAEFKMLQKLGLRKSRTGHVSRIFFNDNFLDNRVGFKAKLLRWS